jgi:NAD(P)-dependent dehydrogenase (short-subunit alcohol dehydrogenase family)
MLAARGARVVVNDVGVVLHGEEAARPVAQDVVDEIIAAGGSAVPDAHDVRDGDAIVDTALDAFGRVDIVINNAGVAEGGPIATGAPDAWERTIGTTLQGSIAVTRAAWPHLAHAPEGGSVVLTASPAMWGSPGSGAYSAAKSALFGLTRSLAAEGRRADVRVNCIMPSAWTRLTKLLPDPDITALLDAHYPPEAVAAFVVWLCHAGTAVTGETFSVGGGRAAKVFLAETKGATVDANEPEAWADAIDQVLDPEVFGVPRDITHEVSWQTLHLGKAVPAAFEDGGRYAWGSR